MLFGVADGARAQVAMRFHAGKSFAEILQIHLRFTE